MVRLASSQVIGPPRLIGHGVEESGGEVVGEILAAGGHAGLELLATREEIPKDRIRIKSYIKYRVQPKNIS